MTPGRWEVVTISLFKNLWLRKIGAKGIDVAVACISCECS
jgi:hypothetical protein